MACGGCLAVQALVVVVFHPRRPSAGNQKFLPTHSHRRHPHLAPAVGGRRAAARRAKKSDKGKSDDGEDDKAKLTLGGLSQLIGFGLGSPVLGEYKGTDERG